MRAVIMQGPGFYGISAWLMEDAVADRLMEDLRQKGWDKTLGEGVVFFGPPIPGQWDTQILMVQVHDDGEMLSFCWDSGHADDEDRLRQTLGLPKAS